MWDAPVTMSHILNECPSTMVSDGVVQRLHLADDDGWTEWQ